MTVLNLTTILVFFHSLDSSPSGLQPGPGSLPPDTGGPLRPLVQGQLRQVSADSAGHCLLLPGQVLQPLPRLAGPGLWVPAVPGGVVCQLPLEAAWEQNVMSGQQTVKKPSVWIW